MSSCANTTQQNSLEAIVADLETTLKVWKAEMTPTPYEARMKRYPTDRSHTNDILSSPKYLDRVLTTRHKMLQNGAKFFGMVVFDLFTFPLAIYAHSQYENE